jgi:hypothetical protein
MRKAFKVATVFTGTAAAVTGFTTVGPTLPAYADVQDCPTHPNTSVHLYWSAGEKHGPTCVGNYQYFSGFNQDNGERIRYVSLCAGNNDGWFDSYDPVGPTYYVHDYGRHAYGVEDLGLVDQDALAISNQSWDGGSECSYYN